MTFRTHQQFAVGWVLIAAMMLYSMRISNVNYYLMLVVMLSTGKYGAKFPDLDHNWHSVKDKTTPNWIINNLIHFTGGRHRSRQTHSWDIWLVACMACWFILNEAYKRKAVTEVNYELAFIIAAGFFMGWMSHLFSDMLTSDGVYPSCIAHRKIAFVPRQLTKYREIFIFGLAAGIASIVIWVKTGTYWCIGTAAFGFTSSVLALMFKDIRFNTGNEWEEFVRRVTKVLNNAIGIIAVLFPYINNLYDTIMMYIYI